MAMNGKTLGDNIANLILDSDAPSDVKQKITKLWEDIGGVIVNHIVQNAQIQVPAGTVIIAVSGGSGAPAVGTPNAAPIATTIA